MLIGEQSFFTHNPVVLDNETHNMLSPECRHKEVVMPFGNQGSCIERYTTGGNRRIPLIYRLIQSALLGPTAHHGATVFQTVSNNGPSVIMSGHNDIDFIAGLWSVFRFP